MVCMFQDTCKLFMEKYTQGSMAIKRIKLTDWTDENAYPLFLHTPLSRLITVLESERQRKPFGCTILGQGFIEMQVYSYKL